MALVYSAVRTFAKTYMARYVSMGYSSRMIQEDLMSRFGQAYRFQNIQADIRSVTGMMKKEALIQKITDTTVLPKYVMVETELLAPYRYRVYGKLNVFDTETGQSKEQLISFYADDMKSKADMIDDFLNMYSDMYYDQSTVINSMSITSVEHDRRLSY